MAKKKKKKEAEESAKDGNVVLFTALSMILLAFFIVLNSIATLDQNRKLAALGSLIGSFGILPGGVLTEKGKRLLPYESPVVEKGENMFDESMRAIERYIVEYQLAENVGFTYEGGNLTISIRSDYIFHPGTAKLKQESLPFLDLVTRLVSSVSNKVWVEGHLDKGEAASIQTDPWELSLNRAIEVMSYTVERGNISPERFSVGGYGASKPAREVSWVRRRIDGRVDITLLGEVMPEKKGKRGVFNYKGFTFTLKNGD